MAKFGPLKDGFISIAGVDLSDHCAEFTLNTSTAELENSAMGDYTDFSTPGLLKWSVEAKFYQDFASGSVHSVLEALRAQLATLGVPPVAPIVLRPSKTNAVSATNPQWSGDIFISKYPPLGGKHGENLMVAVTMAAASNLAVASA